MLRASLKKGPILRETVRMMRKETAQKMREMRVARAAPETPSAGLPQWPKMNTQLSRTFIRLEITVIHIAYLVLPTPSAKKRQVKNGSMATMEARLMK